MPLGSVLAPFLGYKFSLPLTQLKAGLAYAGPRARLRRLVRDLMIGTKPIKIGALGGSVTTGHGTSDKKYSWFSVFSQWVVDSFPETNITARNGAVPATPCTFMIMCLEHAVDLDADLVFVEYVMNNGDDYSVINNRVVKDVERLVRRLLALPGKPAVVLMQVPNVGMANLEPPRTPFYATVEDVETSLSHYYDVQALSLRTALYELAEVEQRDGFRWRDLFTDHHPGDAGHRMMADLAVFLMQETAVDLLLNPLEAAEVAAIHSRPLRRPMYEGNESPESTMCAVGTSFQSMVLNATGFNFTDEDRGKWGFVAREPGAELVVRLDTRRRVAAGAGPAPNTTQVYFHHLKSYEHMGKAEFRCSSNCTCEPLTVDGHHDKLISQTYIAPMLVSASADCRVTIRVLHDTSSGEHKFKVSGVVVAEDQAAAGLLERMAHDHGMVPEGDFEHGVTAASAAAAAATSSGQGQNGTAARRAQQRLRRVVLEQAARVTWGSDTSDKKHSWFSVFSQWLIKSFPQTSITARNGAVRGTPCTFMTMCLEQAVDLDADLVFVEYILNNASLSHYYDVQALSLRTALYELAEVEQRDGFRWQDLFTDFHPGDAGHRMMADLAVFLMQTYIAPMLVSASADCRVTIRVLPETSSGEHKFKVSGVVLAEDQAAAGILERISQEGGKVPGAVFEHGVTGLTAATSHVATSNGQNNTAQQAASEAAAAEALST
ncbi:hypothetical protein HYH03_012560 [Edaphochlamys debaryana]|uniref:SGNH hydrolase-type esterase domain-containing protein n=1 Tax=Edaphochlamys debaryana TaxID=47281 RepID=A0A835XSH8_9CHLO|nr:hypothetical protein HYH03_012560 [Edaphochlamys debaryana]|eukprot:KAG2488939.1 hypothetical protein HYH03_012560 [Edaphochlamys debaryana]